MINALLPGEAEVHHLTLRTLNVARDSYDLVVLGTGNGLFPPLLGDEVLDVSRAKTSIGIFGTQCRELIPRPAFDRLIERLDTWFARYEDDVLMYGRGRNNVVHIGDWLIDQFPLSRASTMSRCCRRRSRPDLPSTARSHHPAPQAGLFDGLGGAAVRAHLGRLAAYAEMPARQPDLRPGSSAAC